MSERVGSFLITIIFTVVFILSILVRVYILLSYLFCLLSFCLILGRGLARFLFLMHSWFLFWFNRSWLLKFWRVTLRTWLFMILRDWLRRWRLIRVCVNACAYVCWHINLNNWLYRVATLGYVFIKNCDNIIYVIVSLLSLFYFYIVVKMIRWGVWPDIGTMRRAQGWSTWNSDVIILHLTCVDIDRWDR